MYQLSIGIMHTKFTIEILVIHWKHLATAIWSQFANIMYVYGCSCFDHWYWSFATVKTHYHFPQFCNCCLKVYLGFTAQYVLMVANINRNNVSKFSKPTYSSCLCGFWSISQKLWMKFFIYGTFNVWIPNYMRVRTLLSFRVSTKYNYHI